MQLKSRIYRRGGEPRGHWQGGLGTAGRFLAGERPLVEDGEQGPVLFVKAPTVCLARRWVAFPSQLVISPPNPPPWSCQEVVAVTGDDRVDILASPGLCSAQPTPVSGEPRTAPWWLPCHQAACGENMWAHAGWPGTPIPSHGHPFFCPFPPESRNRAGCRSTTTTQVCASLLPTPPAGVRLGTHFRRPCSPGGG